MNNITVNLSDYFENPVGDTTNVEVNPELAKQLKESQSKTAYIENGRNFKRYNRKDKECNLPSLEISLEYLIEECDESLLGGTEWCSNRRTVEHLVESKIIAEQAMSALNDDKIGQFVIWLRYYKDYTEAEIGEVIEMSQQRVSVKIHQCLRKMKKALV